MVDLEEEYTKEIETLIEKSSSLSSWVEEKAKQNQDIDHEDVQQNLSTTKNHENLSARQLALDKLDTIVTSLATKLKTFDEEESQQTVQKLDLSKDSISGEEQQSVNATNFVDQLKNKVDVLESEKEVYSQEMERRVNALVSEAVTEAIAEAKQEANITESSLVQRIQELESEINLQSNTHATVEESLQSKIKELEEITKNSNQGLEDQIQHLSSTVEELRTANDQLKLDVETEKELHKQHTDKYNTIESQIRELEETNESLKDELATKAKEIETFEQTKSGEITQLSQSFEENSERLKEMFMEQQQLQAMNLELKLANAQSNNEAEQRVQEKESEIASLNERLELTKNEQLELQKRLQLLEDNALEKDEDLKNLNLTLDEKCREYESLAQTKQELQEKNSKLENLVSFNEIGFKKLISEKDDQLAFLKRTLDDNKTEVARLDTHCLTLEEKNSELANLVSTKEAEIEKLISEKDDELAVLNTTIEGNKTEMARLDSHCSTLQEQNLTLEQTIQNQMEEFQESLSCREKEIDLLNKSVEETTGGLLKLKEQNQKLLTDAQQLEKNLVQSSTVADVAAPPKLTAGDDHINCGVVVSSDVPDLMNVQESRSKDDTNVQQEVKNLKGL